MSGTVPPRHKVTIREYRSTPPIRRVMGRVEPSAEGFCLLEDFSPSNERGSTGGRLVTHVVWEHFYGPVPEGMCVLHRCDVPRCVFVAHMFLGTRADNNRDRALKGRSNPRPGIGHNRTKTECPRGHPYDEANTYFSSPPSAPNGFRQCRACRRGQHGPIGGAQ